MIAENDVRFCDVCDIWRRWRRWRARHRVVPTAAVLSSKGESLAPDAVVLPITGGDGGCRRGGCGGGGEIGGLGWYNIVSYWWW
jgi:hypothetical protein